MPKMLRRRKFLSWLVLLFLAYLLLFTTLHPFKPSNSQYDWRFASKAIQERIHELQHPVDCSKNKLLIYDVSTQVCGFACTMHQLSFYFEVAFATNRTVVLQGSASRLAFFQAYVSDNCKHWENDTSIKDIGKCLLLGVTAKENCLSHLI